MWAFESIYEQKRFQLALSLLPQFVVLLIFGCLLALLSVHMTRMLAYLCPPEFGHVQPAAA